MEHHCQMDAGALVALFFVHHSAVRPDFFVLAANPQLTTDEVEELL
jgi:hypothetical protein